MAEGLFTITELGSDGNPDGERFVWTSDTRPPDGERGGGRATPLGGWPIGIKQRTVRTDYAGATLPSEQVLGAARKPFTLNGKWDDRYNFPGYARAEWDRMEKMVERGSMVRFQFLGITLEGIIVDLDADYRRDWDIRYSFTVSVHQRPQGQALTRSPDTVLGPAQLFDDLDIAVQATLELDDLAPRSLMVGTTATDTEANLARMADSRNQLGATLDGREVLPTEKPVDAFTRLATQFRQVQADAFDTVLDLADARSDVQMAVQTVMGVLDFEGWLRGIRFAARIAMGSAYKGDSAATERAEPDARRFHRTFEGEHLYAIAQKYYGTKDAWRLIADRNALTSMKMTGDEVLVIPERGG